MGNCGNRDTQEAALDAANQYYSSASEYSSQKYNEASEWAAPHMQQAAIDYADQIEQGRINYEIAKMYASGYVIENVKDESRCKFISQFEKDLPLRNISLVEYERRLKKLVTPSMEDKVTVNMVVECFKDHWAFKDIAVPYTLTRELMFDKLFLCEKSNDEEIEEPEEGEEPDEDSDQLDNRSVHVPMLMLLGLLYCRSNRKQRAEKFYELVEIELTNTIKDSDPEFRDYVPFLYEIAYKLMFRLYARHRDMTPPEDGKEQLQPEIDVMKYVTNDYEIDFNLKQKYVSRFAGQLFQAMNRLDRSRFISRLETQLYNLLQPHDIRNKAFEKFLEANPA